MLKKILQSMGVFVLFGCSGNNQQEINDLLNWYSAQLAQLSTQIAADVALDKQGHYPHTGKVSYQPAGTIAYVLLNKHGKRLEVSKKLHFGITEIQQTPGYQKLASQVAASGWQLTLEEHKVDGDGVDTNYSLDEYISDPQRYYIIRLSGWL